MQSYNLYVGQLKSLSFFPSPSLFVSLLFFSQHVYAQVVVNVAHIFPWFYVQERLTLPENRRKATELPMEIFRR